LLGEAATFGDFNRFGDDSFDFGGGFAGAGGESPRAVFEYAHAKTGTDVIPEPV
jgi:hypothetical protein